MGQKVTMKDIANEVGVSAATVSYVLNYSDEEKISHETRLKVFDAAKRLGYVPNMVARSLAGKSSQMVAIIVNLSEKNKRSKLHHYYDIVNELHRQMHNAGYDTLLLSTKEIKKEISLVTKRALEGLFVIGMSEQQLGEIANHYYVPVVFVDGYIEDALFFKILPDYPSILAKAKAMLQAESPYIVIEDLFNDYFTQIVQEQFLQENIFVNRKGSSLVNFLRAHESQKGIIMGELLALQTERIVDPGNIVAVISTETDPMLLPDTRRIVVSGKKEAECAADIMIKLMNLGNFEDLPKLMLIPPIEDNAPSGQGLPASS